MATNKERKFAGGGKANFQSKGPRDTRSVQEKIQSGKERILKGQEDYRNFQNSPLGFNRGLKPMTPTKNSAQSTTGPNDGLARQGSSSSMQGTFGPNDGLAGQGNVVQPVVADQNVKQITPMKKGGSVKKKMTNKPVSKYSSGGSMYSASKRGDGIASKGKTRGKMV